MTAAEHKAAIKAEKDAEKAYQEELKGAPYTANTDDNATCIVNEAEEREALFPSGLPLERPHYTLTDKCRMWDKAQADALADAQPKLEPLVLKPGDEGYQETDPDVKGKKGKKDDYQE